MASMHSINFYTYTPEQIATIDLSTLPMLPNNLVRHVTPGQVPYLADSQFEHLVTQEQIGTVPCDKLVMLPGRLMRYITPLQLEYLSNVQLNYLVEEGANSLLGVSAVERLLQPGASRNPPEESGVTSVMIAAAHLNMTVLATFLSRGVDPNAQDTKWNANALYHTLWGTPWRGIKPPDTTLPSSSRRLSVNGSPMEPKRVEVAQLLIQAETNLFDHHLAELRELLNALEQNLIEMIDELIKRYKENPFVRLAKGYIEKWKGSEVEEKTDLLNNMKRILDAAETLKQQKKQIVESRAKFIKEALATCSANGIPKEVATLISEFCYC